VCFRRARQVPPKAALASPRSGSFAQSPQRKDVAGRCANDSRDGECYPPGILPALQLHVDLNSATSPTLHREEHTDRVWSNLLDCNDCLEKIYVGDLHLMPRTLSALAIALILTLSAAAQDTWQLDPPHSSAQFSVRHLGVSTVRGAFTKVSVRCNMTRLISASLPSRPPSRPLPWTHASRCATTICAARAFLDAQKYPTITFTSKKVEAALAGS